MGNKKEKNVLQGESVETKNLKKKLLKSVRQSKKNPFILILNQHQENRLRVAKITAVVFTSIVVLFLISLIADRLQKKRQRINKINRILKKIKAFDKERKETDSKYKKCKIIFNIIKWINCAQSIDDYKNAGKWERMREKYHAFLEKGGKPQSHENFICPSALIDMVYIPAGKFFMGKQLNEKGDNDELPRRLVVIPYEFWMARTEITISQYRKFFPRFRIKEWKWFKLDSPYQPVADITWHQANEYCRMLTVEERSKKRLPTGYEYRLPTEAEWEYAYRAGTDTVYYWGNEFDGKGAKYANTLDKYSDRIFGWRGSRNMPINDNFRVSAPVASYKPNAFGLYDMAGNVWEWCYDWYNPRAYSELLDEQPVELEPIEVNIPRLRAFDVEKYYIQDTAKVIRGGSWGNLPKDCRAAARDFEIPSHANIGIGFRIVLSKKMSLLRLEQ